MSDISTIIKRLFLPLFFTTAVISLPVKANTIRIVGPSQDEQPVTQSSIRIPSGQLFASSNRYGPTTNQETLWSIASRYRPNDQVSIYQVLGAVFRHNPQAFEHNNIHGLIPGSILTIPSLEQIQREDIAAVKARLAADKSTSNRIASSVTHPKPAAHPAPEKVHKPEPKVVAKPLGKPAPNKEESIKPSSQSVAKPSSSNVMQIPDKPAALQNQLDASDEQMTKLLESNHLLRVRLAEMQHEVAALKEQVIDDEQLREQIKGFIEQQRAQVTQKAEPKPSFFDRMIENPLALAAMALIPGALIAGALAFFLLGRKKEEDDEVKSLDGSLTATEPTAMMSSPESGDDELVPNITLGSDDAIDNLFATDDALFDDPENSLFNDADSGDIATHDDYGVDTGFVPSSISVNSDEQAIGLQDMERALDEMDKKVDRNSDEALAATWEQSLESDDEEDSFDLSYEEDELGFDSLEGDNDGLLDQAMLDDLFSGIDDEPSERDQKSEDALEQLIDQNDLDSLFDNVLVNQDQNNVENKESEEQLQQAEIEQALAEAQMLSDSSQDDIDALFAENSVALLDELVGGNEDDTLTSDIELEEDSTELLDEVLVDGDSDDELPTANIEVGENSVDLLDDLVGEQADDEEIEVDLSEEKEEPVVNAEDIEVGADNTDLLDDILAKYGTRAPQSAEPEPLLNDEYQQELSEIKQLLASSTVKTENNDDEDIASIGRTVEQLLDSLEAEAETKTTNEAFPIFDEETALAEADMFNEEIKPDSITVPEHHDESFDVDDFPEFDEEAAFNDPEAEPEKETSAPVSEDEEQAVLNNIVRQLQQAVEAAEKPSVVPPTPEAPVETETVRPENELSLSESIEKPSIHGHQQVEFESLDLDQLPEFGEDDALQASFDEQHELEQYELEQGFRQPAEPTVINQQPTAATGSGIDAKLVDAAGLDMEALLSEPELPTQTAIQPPMAPVDDDENLAGLERDELFAPSARADDDSILVDDNLSDEDTAIWSANNPEPELEVEDWADQPEMNNADVAEFDVEDWQVDDSESLLVSEQVPPVPAPVPETDTVTPPVSPESYISIEELMKDLDVEASLDELDSTPLNLDVGLDEFPDVLSGIDAFDVDSQGEFASKLDLAKAYLEMNDSDGARDLLEEIARHADEPLKQEAKVLLGKVRG